MTRTTQTTQTTRMTRTTSRRLASGPGIDRAARYRSATCASWFSDVLTLERAHERVESVLEPLDDVLAVRRTAVVDEPGDALEGLVVAVPVVEHEEALDAGAGLDELVELPRAGGPLGRVVRRDLTADRDAGPEV